MFDTGVNKPERPLRKDERIAVAVILALFLGAMSFEILTNNYTPRKLSAFFIPLFWMPLVAIHEAGHAIVARLCGWEVKRIVIGFGRLLKNFKIGNTTIHIRQVPLEGYVLPLPKDLNSPRLKNTLIFAAGPGIEIAIVLAIYFIIGHQTLLSKSDSIAIIAAQSLCVSALMGVIINLIPHWTKNGGWSDGMGMLMSWRLPDSHFEKIRDKPGIDGR